MGNFLAGVQVNLSQAPSSMTVLLGRITIGILLWLVMTLTLLGALTVLYVLTSDSSLESSLELSTRRVYPETRQHQGIQAEETSPETGYPVAIPYSE